MLFLRYLIVHHVSFACTNSQMCRLAQYKGGEPRRAVQKEGSESGKSFSELYKLGKQVSFVCQAIDESA